MYYSSSTNPKTHLLAKRIFHVVFFHFQTKKAQRIVGSPVSKRIWVCLYRCFKDLKQDKFKFYYKSKFLLHSSQGRYHFFIFWKINESAYLFIIFFSSKRANREFIPPEHKFFCEDIEPISLIWTKVDEAMSSSVISDDCSFDDLDNLEEADTDNLNEEIPTLIHNSRWWQ